MALALIIGLGNPGPQYTNTRHNAGAWFVSALARQYQQPLHFDTKHNGWITAIYDDSHHCRLFIPNSAMNVCGLSIQSLVRFYKVPLTSVLIAHDELDFAPGIIRLKQGGGHAGHNGLRDIIKHVKSAAFYRLRIGIGHPGHRGAVVHYVLRKPSLADKMHIDHAIETAVYHASTLIAGDIESVMQKLHTD